MKVFPPGCSRTFQNPPGADVRSPNISPTEKLPVPPPLLCPGPFHLRSYAAAHTAEEQTQDVGGSGASGAQALLVPSGAARSSYDDGT